MFEIIVLSAVLSAGIGDSTSPTQLDSVVTFADPIQQSEELILTQSCPSVTTTEILSHSNILVREYAANGGAQLIRLNGHSASRTQVLWNGFSLQSNSLGSTDLSLVPAFFLNSISINQFEGSVYSGSSAIGGTVKLNSSIAESKQEIPIEIQQEFWPNQRQVSSINIGLNQNHYSIQYLAQFINSDGKFEYQDVFKPNSPNEVFQHNHLAQISGQLNISLKPNPNSTVEVNYFHLSKQKELPRNLGEYGNSFSKQADSIQRIAAHFHYQKSEQHKVSMSAFFDQHALLYTDQDSDTSDFSIYSRIQNTQYQFKLNYQYENSVLRIEQNLLTKYLISQSSRHLNHANRIEQYYSIHFIPKQVKFLPTVGSSILLAEGFHPFPSIQLSKQVPIRSTLKLSLSGASVFRLPTMNDLYWAEGGNPNLDPESGWKANLEVSSTKDFFDQQINVKSSIYGSILKNGILWSPSQVGNFWSPENVELLKNFSFNSELILSSLSGKIPYHFQIDYQYTYARAEEQKIQYQMIYVPKHSLNAQVTLFQKQPFQVQLWYRRLSDQFTDKGNTEVFQLDPYGLWNASIQYHVKLNSTYQIEIQYQIRNILDTPYQVTRSYAQPGRNQFITLKISN